MENQITPSAATTGLATTGPATRDLALTPDATHVQIFDAYGHDPADYDWVPVLKKPRSDGWSPEKQRTFIATLADTGSVTRAARAVHMSRETAYALRRSAHAGGFAAAWDAAIGAASKALVDVAMDRALNGVDVPIFDRDGQRIASDVKYNDRLLMFLLRAHAPERYRHASRDGRDGTEPLVPAALPVAEALRLIDPVPPAEPHQLMAPETLDVALECAELLDGQLPHWHRDQDMLAMENAKSAPQIAREEALEAKLEAAKWDWSKEPKPVDRGRKATPSQKA